MTLEKTDEGFYRICTLPSEEKLKEYYKSEYFKDEHSNYKHKYSEEKKQSFLDKVNKKIDILELLKKPGSVLDIGCGEGWGLRAFTERGWEVTGLDYTKEPCLEHNPEYADKIIEGDLYESFFDWCDVLYLDNILEHVIDPYKLLEFCYLKLGPGGVMIIEVPNSNSEYHQYLVQKGAWKGNIKSDKEIEGVIELAYPDHLSYFNINGFRNLCKASGFKEHYILDIERYDLEKSGESIEGYIDSLSIERAVGYYSFLASLGFGAEMVGFFSIGGEE